MLASRDGMLPEVVPGLPDLHKLQPVHRAYSRAWSEDSRAEQADSRCVSSGRAAMNGNLS